MNNHAEPTTRVRINITLPKDTLNLLDRVTQKGDRSKFLDRAVRFYVKEKGQNNLKEQLKKGAIQRSELDLAMAEEWFPLEDEVWSQE